MTGRQISFHAHPTTRQFVVTRLRIFMGTFAGQQFVLGGLFGPPLLWVLFRVISEDAWPSRNNLYFIVGPAMALGMLVLAGLSGLNHPQTKAFLRDGTRYLIGPEEVSIWGTEASSVVRWSVFTGAVEHADLFVLRIGNMMHLLPKADLSAGDVAALRDLLRSRLGKKARLRPG